MREFSINCCRLFNTSASFRGKVTLNNIKNKNLSSQLWLKRQLTDPYVEKAKIMSYRCRSAFKLIEINEKYKFLKPGQTVVDCGAAPGSWTQVVVRQINTDVDKKIGKVIAIDRQPIYPIEGAIILGNMDFTTPDSQSRLKQELGDAKVQVVLSDMAPKATGIREMDNENMMMLCYTVLKFAVQVSEVNATILMKLWQCGQAKNLENDVSRFYSNVRFVKPKSSRADSAETFILGRNFKGIETS